MSTRNLKGLVLAGGKGTRLRPLTYTTAKQLVPVANHPILHYVMDNLYQAGVQDIGVIISPETGDLIKDSLAKWLDGKNATLTYISQDAPLGLAHAVKTAQPFIDGSCFAMYLGDNLVQSELSTMVNRFKESDADAHILLKAVENPHAFGVATLNDEGQVIQLEEKPKAPKTNLALVGVYLFTPEIFTAIDQIKPSWRGELEITDAIQQLITNGKKVDSYEINGWWLDTGKKDDLLEANRIVLDQYCTYNVQGAQENADIRGRVEIQEGTWIHNSTITGPVRIGKNCEIRNSYIGPFTSIADNCKIIDSEIENTVLLDECDIQEIPTRIESSLIGQGCKLSRSNSRPSTLRFMLSDHATLELL